MATEEITISELELADEILSDMVLPVETPTATKSATLKQIKQWIGASLPTGFILPAIGKMDDLRFTLLDGKTIAKNGTYASFCAKVVEQAQKGNWFACSEEEYQANVAKYGQCGRFVIANDYVRIPKITRFVGATITLSEIGRNFDESLPNLKGDFAFSIGSLQGNGARGGSGVFAGTTNGDTTAYNGYDDRVTTTTKQGYVPFNAQNSSGTYKDGAKVQPEHIKFPYYMVISTEGQTAPVTIDVNKVYEDMNLRAMNNFNNVTAEGKRIASGWGMPSGKAEILPLMASGGQYTAPANGYFAIEGKFDVLDMFNLSAGNLGMTSQVRQDKFWRGFTKAEKGQKVLLAYSGTPNEVYIRFVYAEGEI